LLEEGMVVTLVEASPPLSSIVEGEEIGSTAPHRREFQGVEGFGDGGLTWLRCLLAFLRPMVFAT